MPLEIKGLEVLKAQLNELRDVQLAGKILARAARRAFKPVLDAAKAMAPKDTGALADSLTISAKRPKGGDSVVVVGIKIGAGRSKQAAVAAAAFGEGQLKTLPPARRWHFIELGTSKLPAHPFLRPALDSNSQAVLDALVRELREGIKRAGKGRGKR